MALTDQQNNNNGTDQSKTSSNQGGMPASSGGGGGESGMITSEKTSPGRLAEDLGNGKKQGSVIYIQDTITGKLVAKTNKFYMQQFAIGLKERSQILETFGTANVSFFGSSAKMYNFGGTTLD